jgi:hypothetical protein
MVALKPPGNSLPEYIQPFLLTTTTTPHLVQPKVVFFVLNLVKYYEFLGFLPFSIYFAVTQLTPQLREMVTSLLRHPIEHKISYPTI